jgi:pimeloyl-ACP methyl ester carboxylesterase
MTKLLDNRKIDSLDRICLGGVNQWISIRSINTDNPIILFLHGGPGTAQIFFSRKSQRLLEEDFIVVNWDQRGAGKSFYKKLKKEDMTIEQFIADCEELIEYLLNRFNQRKLFLVGHSWGSVLGIKIAYKKPDKLWAYIGIGQVVDISRGEKISYRFTLDEANHRNNSKAIRDLEKIGYPPYSKLSDSGIQRRWLSKFNGSTYNSTIIGTILKNITLSDISINYVIKFVKGIMFSLSCLEEQLNNVNILSEINEIKIPVYFCSGRKDYTVPHELVSEFANVLIASKKEIIWFERSAHLSNFEESDKFCKFCTSIKSTISEDNI